MDNVEFSVSHTTRPKRPMEKEGRDYYFTGREEFAGLVEKDELLEWAEVHGHLYGTSRREISKKSSSGDVLLDIDVQGASQVRQKITNAVFVFILPPRYRELKKRLEQRGEDDPNIIQRRLETARKEIQSYTDFDYIIINDDLDQAAEKLKSIVAAARCRIDERRKQIGPVLKSFLERKPE